MMKMDALYALYRERAEAFLNLDCIATEIRREKIIAQACSLVFLRDHRTLTSIHRLTGINSPNLIRLRHSFNNMRVKAIVRVVADIITRDTGRDDLREVIDYALNLSAREDGDKDGTVIAFDALSSLLGGVDLKRIWSDRERRIPVGKYAQDVAANLRVIIAIKQRFELDF